ncbi:hypothetical protein FIBSPDRAFT_685117, partial [Athelia psychrophila]
FVASNNLSTVPLRKPLRMLTINNSDISSGLITRKVTLRVSIDDHSEDLALLVTDIGDDNIILGMNWLR